MPDDQPNPWREAADRGFVDPPRDMAHEPLIGGGEPVGEGPYEEGPRERSGWGCLMWGCLGVVVLALVTAIVGGVIGYYFLKGQIELFTDDAPAELPVVEMDEAETAELIGRIDAFRERLGIESEDDPGEVDAPAPEEAAPADVPGERAPLELVLTADQINALFAEDPDLRGRVHIRIEEGQITGDVSLPTDALPMASGRFFNASATFEVELTDGNLTVYVVDASVKGKRIPQAMIDAFSKENLAQDIETEEDAYELIDRIESLRIEGDRVILIAKPPVETQKEEIVGTANNRE